MVVAKVRKRAREQVFRPGFDAAWEAAEAARGNYDHADAVHRSYLMERVYRKQWGKSVASSTVELYELLRTLTRKKIPFVLTGAYAIGGWTGKPRSTQDIDILVKSGRNYVRAVKAVKELYPQLTAEPFPAGMRFYIPGEPDPVIDVVFPTRDDIADTLASPIWTENREHRVRYRVPSLENALANKYGAMMSPNRDVKKRGQDAIDFAWMVIHSTDEGRTPIDLARVIALAELANPGKGGKDIVALIERVKAGKPINLE